MISTITQLPKFLPLILFGNYDFMNDNGFAEFFKMKFKINKKQLQGILLILLTIFFLLITSQAIIWNKISVNLIILELILIFFLFRIINYILVIQFKQYCTTTETMGYFIVNELIMILDTSGSLKDAVKFIILGNYPIYSKIFNNALLLSHFGSSLENSLCEMIKRNLSGNIRSIFLNILETWQSGKNIAILSKRRIMNQISVQITEEINKIDSWASLSSGLIFLSPPVILCFLLISGKMNLLFGILIIIGMISGSFFIDPDRNLITFSDENQVYLAYETKSLEFLTILGENLSKGKSFSVSLNEALNIIAENNLDKNTNIKPNLLAGFKIGPSQIINSEVLLLEKIFSERVIHIIFLVKKFAKIDNRIAGVKLLKIAEELNETNELLQKGNAKRKAAKLQANIIQIFALISLAIISGMSPFFIYVSGIITHSFSKPLTPIKHSGYELLFLITAMVMSFLPIKKIKLKELKEFGRIPWRELLNFSKFLLFLMIYTIVKNFFLDIY